MCEVARGQSLTEAEGVLRATFSFATRLARAPHVATPVLNALAECHIITGGTSGVGLLTARWLAQQRGASALAFFENARV